MVKIPVAPPATYELRPSRFSRGRRPPWRSEDPPLSATRPVGLLSWSGVSALIAREHISPSWIVRSRNERERGAGYLLSRPAEVSSPSGSSEASFIFPLLFIGVLGRSFQSNLGASSGFNFLTFTFTGVLAQTLFQSTAQGIISLLDDRENDFSQEIFVSPISRYAIILGKIVGESLVSLIQAIGIILFGLIIGVPLSVSQLLALVPVALIICLFGGSFGILILSNLTNRQLANLVFPFILLPQFFLAGVFNPIQVLPLPLDTLSRISPLRYAVDLARGIYYAGEPEYSMVVLPVASRESGHHGRAVRAVSSSGHRVIRSAGARPISRVG